MSQQEREQYAEEQEARGRERFEIEQEARLREQEQAEPVSYLDRLIDEEAKIRAAWDDLRRIGGVLSDLVDGVNDGKRDGIRSALRETDRAVHSACGHAHGALSEVQTLRSQEQEAKR